MLSGCLILRPLGPPHERRAVLAQPLGIDVGALVVLKACAYREPSEWELGSFQRHHAFARAQLGAAELYELGQVKDQLVLGREYVLGESLESLEGTVLTAALARYVAVEVCRLVERLHLEDPLGHGSLRPGNVFVSFAGLVKVTGFGAALLRPSASAPSHHADLEALRGLLTKLASISRMTVSELTGAEEHLSVTRLRESIEALGKQRPVSGADARHQLAEALWLRHGARALLALREVLQRIHPAAERFENLLSQLPFRASPAWKLHAVAIETFRQELECRTLSPRG